MDKFQQLGVLFYRLQSLQKLMHRTEQEISSLLEELDKGQPIEIFYEHDDNTSTETGVS